MIYDSTLNQNNELGLILITIADTVEFIRYPVIDTADLLIFTMIALLFILMVEALLPPSSTLIHH